MSRRFLNFWLLKENLSTADKNRTLNFNKCLPEFTGEFIDN